MGGRECHGLVELATWKKVPQIKGRVSFGVVYVSKERSHKERVERP